jgi:formyl-CoA transferase
VFVPGLGETFPLPGVGFLAQGSNGYVDSPPPELGEHSVQTLREIGVEDAEIQRLLAAGVIKAAGGASQDELVANDRS